MKFSKKILLKNSFIATGILGSSYCSKRIHPQIKGYTGQK
jgi:hypothetical protein